MNCHKCKAFRGADVDTKFVYVKCGFLGEDKIELKPYVDDIYGEIVIASCPKAKEGDILMH